MVSHVSDKPVASHVVSCCVVVLEFGNNAVWHRDKYITSRSVVVSHCGIRASLVYFSLHCDVQCCCITLFNYVDVVAWLVVLLKLL